MNYWDEKNEPREPTFFWMSAVLDVCCQARFWTSGAGFGVSLTITDVRVTSEQPPLRKRKCPWG